MKKLEPQDKVRLAKFISACGISSRRQAELLILEGRVKLNGKIVKEVATKIDPQIDKVTVNDEVLKFSYEIEVGSRRYQLKKFHKFPYTLMVCFDFET
jgi:16S rRNA U516 pseudouridylate synthase RsuA-like enzyme